MLTVVSNPLGWNAVHSPLIVEFQRKDLDVINTELDTGNPQYTPTRVSPITTDLTGKTVYINSGCYVGNYVVYSQYNYTGYSLLYLTTPFISVTVGGYIVSDDYRLNYSIDLLIYNGSSTLITTLNFGTFTDGVAEVDISEVLSKNINQFPTAAINSLGAPGQLSDIYSTFQLGFREKYTGYTSIISVFSLFWGVNAVLQDGTVNDGTLNNYMPYLDVATPSNNRIGKFLQGFTEPVMNISNPFELHFIYSGGDLPDYPLTLFVKYLNINKGTIGTYTSLISDDSAGYLCRVNLNSLTIPSDAFYLEVYVEAGDTQSRYFEVDYIEDGYIDSAVISTTDQKIVQSLFIRIDRSILNLTELRWLNLEGGISQWTFNYTNSLNNENKDSKAIITNDNTKVSNINVISNKFNRFISVGADGLTYEQWYQLSLINIAQIYQDGNWMNVFVEQKNDDVDARGMYSREMTIRLNPLRTHKF